MPIKLLDYGRPNPFGEIVGKPRYIAWPVNVYRVTLPKMSENGEGLNPFERVILKMIDADGLRETAALALETCIPVDLVQSVLLRLRDKAFIDDHNGIIEQRRHKWGDQGEDPTTFVTALIFRELAAGKILPFLHLLSDQNPFKKKDPETSFRTVRWEYEHKYRRPLPRDVISSLRAMKKRSVAFDDEVRLPAVQKITIAQNPEFYYLDCPIAIQKSDGEFRIADPFGNGFSLVLENSFSRLLEQDGEVSSWLMDWRQRLANPEMENPAAAPKEPYDNDENWGRYRNLVSNLRLKQNAQHRSIEQIYAALEWALFYACARYSYDTVINQLRFANQSEHPGLLKAAAERIGLRVPPSGLRPVPVGKLDDFLSGNAEMGTVLSLSLLLADNDDWHPLRHLVTGHPDLIIRILEIKKKRDEQTHGKGKAQRSGMILPDEVFMCEMVTTLLPSMGFSGAAVAEVDLDLLTDSLLDARTSIQGEFGFKLFNRLGTNLQDDLIYAETFWLSCKEGDDACAFLRDICAALQRAFLSKLSGVLPPDLKDSELSQTAQNKATDSGLGQLPECLCTVKSNAVQKSLRGENQTLGACVVAFLIVAEVDALRMIADCQPSFFADIECLVRKRGHGNLPLPMPKDGIARLRKQFFSIIKALFEV
jgi:hypothetical protein